MTSSELYNFLFGPLSSKYCLYFHIVSVYFFVLFVIALSAEVIWMYRNMKRITPRTFTSGLIIVFNIFILYFVNRMLYGMCSRG